MIRKFTKRTEKSVFADARRILKGMDEGDPHDDLVEAVADYLAEDPEGVNEILPTEFVGQTKHKFRLTVTFANVVGPTCAVDGILEGLNLLDWRMVCDKFLANVLAQMGEDADEYDWPTPHPEVTHVSEDGDTDVHAAVRLMWPVDEKTWRKVSEFNERKIRAQTGTRGEETCCECDTPIKYTVEKGKTVVMCPNCGTLNPLCRECTRVCPESVMNPCIRCARGGLREAEQSDGERSLK